MCHHPEEKFRSKVVKFTGNMRNALKLSLQFRSFFVRLLVFEIWTILCMVDFDGSRTVRRGTARRRDSSP